MIFIQVSVFFVSKAHSRDGTLIRFIVISTIILYPETSRLLHWSCSINAFMLVLVKHLRRIWITMLFELKPKHEKTPCAYCICKTVFYAVFFTHSMYSWSFFIIFLLLCLPPWDFIKLKWTDQIDNKSWQSVTLMFTSWDIMWMHVILVVILIVIPVWIPYVELLP